MQIPYSVTNQLNHAIYLPALQENYTRYVGKGIPVRNMPKGLIFSDLDFFQPNSQLFNLDAALYSAGLFSDSQLDNPPPCIVTKRTRGANQNTFILGDSGGFSIANSGLQMSIERIESTYNWLVNHTDVAMTLDSPTFKCYEKGVRDGAKFKQCLQDNLMYLDYFRDMGGENQYFLNVLQGGTLDDCETWYNAVKGYNFYGWAIASMDKRQMPFLMSRIIDLMADGKFDKDQTWIHFLGVGTLEAAALMTTLKDELNNLFESCHIEISFDTSTPFTMMTTRYEVCGNPIINASKLQVPSKSIPRKKWVSKRSKFPYAGSEISHYLQKGHIVRRAWNEDEVIDKHSIVLAQNHNVEVQVSAIDAVVQILKLDISREYKQQLLPKKLLDAVDAIKAIFACRTPYGMRSKLLEPKIMNALDRISR